MSLPTILYQILIGPLVLLFETIYSTVYQTIPNPGLSILALSLVVNILVLPLYRCADALQEKQRALEEKLQPGIAHIRKTFRGDERFMMLQTFYRQNNYKPTYALRGSLSLLLEIPFFMAAYRFLSHLQLLQGASFGPIADLGAPDGLLTIGGITLHILPILMTLINVISGAIYTKGYFWKSKWQLYGMAALFLILLYRSPSGLVLYWTLNNLFSLGKNIVAKLLPQSQKQNASQEPEAGGKSKTTGRLFLAGCLLLTSLTGLFLPTRVIASSPEEFVNVIRLQNPVLYIGTACCIAAGLFLVWFGIFYQIAGTKGKRILAFLVGFAALAAIVNAFFFSRNLGTMSPTLVYDTLPVFSMREKIWNAGLLLILFLLILLLTRKKTTLVTLLLSLAAIAFAGSSLPELNKIVQAYHGVEAKAESQGRQAEIQLSKTGKNVIVFMLDRAITTFVPYLMQEKPELQEQFAGFTYYPNSISFGCNTKLGSPALFGGYEYTPEQINKRKDLTLEEKQNEALKLMPKLFSEAGYAVTVCDPPYAGYTMIPSLDIYEDCPGVNAYVTGITGAFNELSIQNAQLEDHIRKRNLFCHSLFRSAPVILQGRLYNSGYYNEIDRIASEASPQNQESGIQVADSPSTATGNNFGFLNYYSVLAALPEITKITDAVPGTLTLLDNDTTHEPTLLQEPAYEPASQVDNTDYDAAHADRFTLQGRTLDISDSNKMKFYHVNMAAFLQLGNWFDYLREQGVYDNTRIILVSDHGYPLFLTDEWVLEGILEGGDDTAGYHALLMMKDFDSTDYTESDAFMTNADTPTLAMQGLVENPVNPYTGNAVNNADKTNHSQKVTASREFEVKKDGQSQFEPAGWYAVDGNALDLSSWEIVEDPTALNEG